MVAKSKPKLNSHKVITDRKKIDKIFGRGVVVDILPAKDEFFKRLLSGERLKIYIGADPTSDSLHLSHAKNYMFLEELRELGHEVIILVGDFTARIGDPTGKSESRIQLTEAQVKKNVRNWVSQIKPLMNFDDKKNPPKILYNSEWLSQLSFKDVVSLASNFTVQQMLERDMFQKRLKENAPIHLHEFLYPLMQGYDSVAMDVDVELCGTDQTFNALAGRTLLRRLKNKEKFIIVVNLMENPKTGELMSKSRGTGVFLSSPPNEMYGAIMAQPDEMTEVLFINCTRIPLSEKNKILSLGPRDAKARIALEIVKKFYGERAAEKARAEFDRVFAKKKAPTDMPEIKISGNGIDIIELLTRAGMPSKSEARRLITQGAVEIEGKKHSDPMEKIQIQKSAVLKVGKTRFFRINVGH